MSRIHAALIASTLSLAALPTTAFAGCYGCYAPPQPCTTCYVPQVIPPQYRTVEETVMVEPGRVIAHRTPAQYQTVMVPQTVMVAPEGVEYERIPPQYATRERVEMVAPASTYYAPVATGCSTCGYGYGYSQGYGYDQGYGYSQGYGYGRGYGYAHGYGYRHRYGY